MTSRVVLTTGWLVVLAAYLIGAVGLALQPRGSVIAAPEHLVAWGALVMFTSVLAFALAFAHAAMITE